MTSNIRSTIEPVGIEPVGEDWVAHLRDITVGITPPTAADPHSMSRVAIRRTRMRRAVLATGGGLTAVAAVAGAAFAIGGPTAGGVLLPGGSTSVSSADPSSDAEPATGAPAGWNVQELEGLTYALPPEMVTSGPVEDGPDLESEMWHSSEDPDAPPFLRIAFYPEGRDNPAWPHQVPKPEAEEFDLPGAELATEADTSAEAAGLPSGTEVPERFRGPVMLTIERADGAGAYMISLNIPGEGSEDFVRQFKASLSLD